jgi:ATP-dependent helicase YprA (DUF1998 family)
MCCDNYLVHKFDKKFSVWKELFEWQKVWADVLPKYANDHYFHDNAVQALVGVLHTHLRVDKILKLKKKSKNVTKS